MWLLLPTVIVAQQFEEAGTSTSIGGLQKGGKGDGVKKTIMSAGGMRTGSSTILRSSLCKRPTFSGTTCLCTQPGEASACSSVLLCQDKKIVIMQSRAEDWSMHVKSNRSASHFQDIERHSMHLHNISGTSLGLL